MPKTANARQSDGTDAALVATLISSNETTDGKQPANMVDGLFAIARAIEKLAFHVKYLGGGDNADTMGAVEFLATKVEAASDRTSEAGDAIAGAIEKLAETIEGAAGTVGRNMIDAADRTVDGIEDIINRNRHPTDTEQEEK